MKPPENWENHTQILSSGNVKVKVDGIETPFSESYNRDFTFTYYAYVYESYVMLLNPNIKKLEFIPPENESLVLADKNDKFSPIHIKLPAAATRSEKSALQLAVWYVNDPYYANEIREYQADYNLPVTGMADLDLMYKIELEKFTFRRYQLGGNAIIITINGIPVSNASLSCSEYDFRMLLKRDGVESSLEINPGKYEIEKSRKFSSVAEGPVWDFGHGEHYEINFRDPGDFLQTFEQAKKLPEDECMPRVNICLNSDKSASFEIGCENGPAVEFSTSGEFSIGLNTKEGDISIPVFK